MTESQSVDIGIVGGGMVGGILANVLANVGYKVCMIESQTYSSHSTPQLIDERSVVLSHSSRVLLELMGLWQGIESMLSPIEHIHVSERGRFGVARIHAEVEHVDALGYVVRNSRFLQYLYGKLQDPNMSLELHTNSSLVDLQQSSECVDYVVKGATGDTWRGSAKLLIAADGTMSAVRDLIAVGVTTQPYDQAAIVANVLCEKDHHNTAYERFTDQGPLAMLPLESRLMAMVYTVDLDDMNEVRQWSDAQMLEAVQQRFGFRLGRFKAIGKQLAFPLSLVQSEQQSVGRVVLLGNAARTLHPVSGQGLNLALRDIAMLIETLLVDGVRGDPGCESALQKFCRQRQCDQKSVVGFTDTLVKVFRGNAPAFAHLRAAGLFGFDCLPPLKHILAQQSMGLASRLPNLATVRSP